MEELKEKVDLGKELFECHKQPTEQDELCDMVDFNFFCNKFYGEIGDWLENNHPDDIINRAERIEAERNQIRIDNMTKKELKADESEYKANAKYDPNECGL